MYIYTDKAVTLCSLSIHIHLQLFLSSRLPEYQLHFQIEFLKLLFTVFQASQRCFTKKKLLASQIMIQFAEIKV